MRLQRRLSCSFSRVACTATDAEQVFDAASTIAEGDLGIGPSQLRSEMVAFLSFVRKEQPHRVLEIGTYKGGTLYLLAWASSEDARLVSLDIRELPPARQRLYRAFARGRQQVEGWRADSSTLQTRDAVQAFFGRDLIDLLFIDGNHTYEAVARDFELYAPLVRPGGWIAFHDIVDGSADLVGQVPRFWQEVKASLADAVEFVESWTQGGYGIGLGRKLPSILSVGDST